MDTLHTQNDDVSSSSSRHKLLLPSSRSANQTILLLAARAYGCKIQARLHMIQNRRFALATPTRENEVSKIILKTCLSDCYQIFTGGTESETKYWLFQQRVCGAWPKTNQFKWASIPSQTSTDIPGINLVQS